MPHASRSGFTLVELSIVLVILGLLVGGVLTGQSLIRASELRAVTSEYQRFQTAQNAFRDKYFALAGDMTNATSFWTSGTANGNGDGALSNPSAAATTGEIFQFWNQLSLAGLIEGKYTGISGPGAQIDTIPGTNSPKSKLSGGGWGLSYNASFGGDTTMYAYEYGNYLAFGSTVGGTINWNPILKPEEAWNIDTKVDDGKPGSGRIMIRENATWSGAAASKCSTSTSSTDYAGLYNLSGTTPSCALLYPKAF